MYACKSQKRRELYRNKAKKAFIIEPSNLWLMWLFNLEFWMEIREGNRKFNVIVESNVITNCYAEIKLITKEEAKELYES